jgi:hypothetical protein
MAAAIDCRHAKIRIVDSLIFGRVRAAPFSRRFVVLRTGVPGQNEAFGP